MSGQRSDRIPGKEGGERTVPRIFLSHSSVDELEAVALKEWLTANGWDDVFLDLDPQRGLAAGELWQEALRRAADRREAVVFIVTPAWAKSKSNRDGRRWQSSRFMTTPFKLFD